MTTTETTCLRCGEVFRAENGEVDALCDRCAWETWFEAERDREFEFPGDGQRQEEAIWR
jgi:hypothetical protein